MRALTHRTSLADLGTTLIRLNQILRGWSTYFRHAVATHTFKHLRQFLWWRIVRWLKTRHRWRWTAVRRHLTDPTGRWKPISADGTMLFDLEKVRHHPLPLPRPSHPQPLDRTRQRQQPWRARCVERRTAGSVSGLGKRDGGNVVTAPQADSPWGRGATTLANSSPSGERRRQPCPRPHRPARRRDQPDPRRSSPPHADPSRLSRRIPSAAGLAHRTGSGPWTVAGVDRIPIHKGIQVHDAIRILPEQAWTVGRRGRESP